MITIHKYTLYNQGGILDLPYMAKFLYMAMDDDRGGVNLWFEVDTGNLKVPVEFKIIGTGREVPIGSEYRGSITEHNPLKNYVWHIYEVTHDPSPNLD